MSNQPFTVSGSENKGRIRKVIVLGGGSAGYLSAIALKIRLPELEVTVIHSKAIPIIGVGEGTTFSVPIFLHGYLGIDPVAFHQRVRPTYKLGIRFLWGERPRFHYSFTNQLDSRLDDLPKANGFFSFEDFEYGDITGALMAHDKGFETQSDGGPMVGTGVAYHIENRDFVSFLESAADEVGVRTVDDEVEGVEQDDKGISRLRLKSGRSAEADLYLDCSGFRSELIGGAFREPFESFSSSLFCDRAIAGGWEREDEILKPYTTAETMECGWAWQIEHDDVINRGYVYSSRFISDEDAEVEFRKKNPKVRSTRLIRFETGAYRRGWIKNVVSMGNAGGFVEPLEATSLSVICDHTVRLIQSLADADMMPGEATRKYYNQYTSNTWSAIRRFLALHYKFNTRLDNRFWRTCREETDLAGAEEIVEYYRECGPTQMWALETMGRGDPFGWEGYLMMLVGQKVPFKKEWRPAPSDQRRWEQFRHELAQRAGKGIGMREALDMIRSANWRWRSDFYQNAVRW